MFVSNNFKDKILKSSNLIILIFLTFLIYKISFSFFIQSEYRHLHIDERQIIDSIFNVFQVVDEFGRFDSIKNTTIQTLLIIVSELIIGGNLDYGRFFNNFFIIFTAPFYFIEPRSVIIAERFLNFGVFIFMVTYISKNFIVNNFRWIFTLTVISLPGSYYLILNSKPDVLSILCFFIGLKNILDNKNLKFGFFFIGLSLGTKIVAIIPVVILFIYYFFNFNTFRAKKFFKITSYFFVGVFFAQPALLIPSMKIYLRIYDAISLGSRYDQEKIFSLSFNNFSGWMNKLAEDYYISSNLFLFFLFIVFTLCILIFLKSDKNLKYFFITFLLFFCFFTFNVERTWTYYLFFPSIFLVIFLFNIKPSYPTKILYLMLLPVLLTGVFFNSEKIINTGFDIDLQKEKSFNEAVLYLDNKYLDDTHKFNVVYWDPDYYFPRYNFDYLSDFIVLENWEEDAKLIPLFSKVDYIVTPKEFNIKKEVKLVKFGDLNIYSLSN